MSEDKIKTILLSEYSEEFDTLRKNRMATSFYKYGPIKDNYNNNLVDCIKSLELRLEKYKETGNTEYLLDIANFSMIEFMYPQHSKVHYKATDSGESPGLSGMYINQIKRYNEGGH